MAKCFEPYDSIFRAVTALQTYKVVLDDKISEIDETGNVLTVHGLFRRNRPTERERGGERERKRKRERERITTRTAKGNRIQTLKGWK